jgi:hypothetical protein
VLEEVEEVGEGGGAVDCEFDVCVGEGSHAGYAGGASCLEVIVEGEDRG